MLCAWCSGTATWVLVADADLHDHDHAACDEHRTAWGHLYRRAVAVSPDLVIEVDVRDQVGSAEIDLRSAEETTGQPEL